MSEPSKHWLSHRLFSLALIPLNLWLVFSLLSHLGDYHIVMVEWIKTPINAILLLLNIGFMFYHAVGGVEEVLLDYIPQKTRLVLSIALIRGLGLFMALACTYAVLYVAFTA